MPSTLGPLALTIIAVSSLGCGNAANSPARRAPLAGAGGALGAECSARFTDSSMVSVDGGYDVYVEGQAFVPAPDGSLLLAGTPNYVSPPSPGHRMVVPANDSVFGAIRSPGGRWSLVPIPAPVRWFSGPRAHAIGDARWEVTFVQLAERVTGAHEERPLGTWYGILSAKGWEHLERITPLDTFRVEYINSTPLMRSGDTLTWAFQVSRPNETLLPAAGVLQRIGKAWHFQLIDVETLGVSGYRAPDGAVRLVVEHVSELPRPEMQGTRYAVAPVLAPIDTVIPPSRLNRFYREVDRSPDGVVSLTWAPQLTDTVMYRISIVLGPDREPGAMRRFPARYPSVHRLAASRGDAPWLFVADRRDANNNGRFEFLRVAPGHHASVGELPHRYIGPMVMAPRIDDRSLRFTGPVLVRDSSEARIASLLTTVDFTCRD